MGRLTRIAALYVLVILGGVEALLWLVPLSDPYNYTVFTSICRPITFCVLTPEAT